MPVHERDVSRCASPVTDDMRLIHRALRIAGREDIDESLRNFDEEKDSFGTTSDPGVHALRRDLAFDDDETRFVLMCRYLQSVRRILAIDDFKDFGAACVIVLTECVRHALQCDRADGSASVREIEAVSGGSARENAVRRDV